jgi:hypothetical protein
VARIEVTRFIVAPPDAVWDVLADIEHQGDWMEDVRRLEIVSERTSGACVIIHVTSGLFGLPVVRDVMEITRWQPPMLMAVAHTGQFTGIGEFRLERVNGGTRFVWFEDVRPPLGRLGEIAFALVVGPYLRRVFRRSLANLGRLAEARASGAQRHVSGFDGDD